MEKEYWFRYGDLRFKDFRLLGKNLVANNEPAFQAPCHIVDNTGYVATFKMSYVVGNSPKGAKHSIILEFERPIVDAFGKNPIMKECLGKHLPKFKRIGSTVPGIMASEKFYGTIEL